MSSVTLLALLATSAMTVAGSSTASGATLVMGKGVGPWTLGEKRVVKPGLERTEVRRGDTGCIGFLTSASRIDYYPAHVVGVLGGRVFDVATVRVGDRSTSRFVIGRSKLEAVRRRHRGARVLLVDDDLALGAKRVSVFRTTGCESAVHLTYWFDSANTLVALETGYTGW